MTEDTEKYFYAKPQMGAAINFPGIVAITDPAQFNAIIGAGVSPVMQGGLIPDLPSNKSLPDANLNADIAGKP